MWVSVSFIGALGLLALMMRAGVWLDVAYDGLSCAAVVAISARKRRNEARTMGNVPGHLATVLLDDHPEYKIKANL
jgi:hypothetical protein